MRPAAQRLARELEGVAVADPVIPVVRNVDGGLTTAAADVKPFLVRQVASPVQWTACVRRIAEAGATVFAEVGPGRVLTGLLKRIVDGARGVSIEDPAGLDKAAVLLGHGA
jgi:[acyl-carrier-protein] S-malonyltransferase